MDRIPCILTIAGSDSGGGAGIQADIKTITMMEGYAASVITALTAQNTAAVTSIQAPTAKFVAKQLVTVLEDIEVDAAKTGMLFSAPIIKAVAAVLMEKTFPLVVDPVCVATSGAKLLKDDAVEAMVEHMFPLADVLTPNIPEAELFTGVTISDKDSIIKAAGILLEMGAKSVLIKGGHTDSYAVTDWFVTPGSDPIPFMQQRVKTDSTHGTGCTLSAAIATGLAKGLNPGSAILKAQDYLNLALRAGYRLGEGGGPPNHLAPWLKVSAQPEVLAAVDELGRTLSVMEGVERLLPKGRSNVAVAVPYADKISEVAGFSSGLIASARNKVSVVGYPEFGAPVQVGSALLAVRRLSPSKGCAMTLAGTPALRDVFTQLGKEIVWLNRDHRPEYVQDTDGALETWGAFEALRELNDPDSVQAIGDPGELGVESVIHLLAEDVASLLASLKEVQGVLTLGGEGL